VANESLFKSLIGKLSAKTDAFDAAGGVAYAMSPRQALAQYAATGCLNSTFYADADEQLETIIGLAAKVEPEFLARVALYARSKAHMKDAPALLVALLSVRSPGLMAEVFDRVIDSPRMLRTFVQVMRSGVVGRKSLGTLPKRLVLQWIASRSDDQLFRASLGAAPSLADIVRMVHPKPATPARAALLGYIVRKPYDHNALPAVVTAFEGFKTMLPSCPEAQLPDVPMEMLTSLPLTKAHWTALARKASWQSLRMNPNTFARHSVFVDGPDVITEVAAKLRDANAIARARVFPYQLLAAFMNIVDGVPPEIRDALQDAMEIAIGNVPSVSGKVWVFPDVSGSMQAPVTGRRTGASSAVRCIDVAALVAASIVRKNPGAGVLPFSDSVVDVSPKLNPRDSVMTNAQRLASLPSGGTNCAAPLEYLNQRKLSGDLLIYVSDNESWLTSAGALGRSTATLAQWQVFKARNPRAKLVCLDVQPNSTTQAPDQPDVLNVGGFADAVFNVISEFNNGTLGTDHWVSVIEKELI